MTVSLPYILIVIGLAAFAALVGLDRFGGHRLDFPYSILWMVVAMIPAAGVALLFYGPARERARGEG